MQRGDKAGNVCAVELREDWKAATDDAASDFGLAGEEEHIWSMNNSSWVEDRTYHQNTAVKRL